MHLRDQVPFFFCFECPGLIKKKRYILNGFGKKLKPLVALLLPPRGNSSEAVVLSTTSRVCKIWALALGPAKKKVLLMCINVHRIMTFFYFVENSFRFLARGILFILSNSEWTFSRDPYIWLYAKYPKKLLETG
jgi:hypothetical protein